MALIKCRILSFDKVNANGTVISKDCKINYLGKVADIIKEDDGLYFVGELPDQDIQPVLHAYMFEVKEGDKNG